MAIIVMVYGQSGTGKSTSLRNFKPEDVCIVNVSGKPLPFKNKHKTFNTDDYMAVDAAIKKAPAKSIVVDDATYLMTDEFMRTAKTPGYQKFTDLALNFFTLVKTASNSQEKLAEASPSQITTALGTLIDKWAMISGGPSDNGKEDELSKSLREMAEELESDD